MSRKELINPSPEGAFDGEEEYGEFHPAHEEHGSRPGRGSAAFLFLLGFSILAAGLALTFAPEYSWRVTKVARRLDALGFQNGIMVMGGVIVFGLGMVARSRASVPSHPPAENTADSDFILVADQLATDLARMNTSLLQIQGELGGIGEAQKTLAHKSMSDDAQVGERQNAMFGLAASLDKLGARMDERFRTADEGIRARFEEMSARLQQNAPAPAVALALPAPSADPQPEVAPEPTSPFVEPELTVKMPTDSPVDAPASALPMDPDPGEPIDPSREIFEAFEGLENNGA